MATILAKNIDFYWYVNVANQISIIILGAITTTIVALRSTSNNIWLRSIAVVCAILLTIAGNAAASFRIKEGYEGLCDLQTEVLSLYNKYVVELSKNSSLNTDLEFVLKMNNELSKLERERRRLTGSFEGARSLSAQRAKSIHAD